MRYHGGKTRYGKHISKIICGVLKQFDGTIDGYIEPFCGMCGVFIHVVENTNLLNYVASDNNPSVISMWKDLGEGWLPDVQNFDGERFNMIKGDGQSSAEKGFFGHAMTFGALYFQSYRPELKKLLSYSMNDVVKRRRIMKDVHFKTSGYKEIFHQKGEINKVIYCDPPYERRSRYYDESNNQISFDSEEFWNECVTISKCNILVISEQLHFFQSHVSGYPGNIRVFTLPAKKNRFGVTTRESGEHICVMTFLDVNLDKIDNMST